MAEGPSAMIDAIKALEARWISQGRVPMVAPHHLAQFGNDRDVRRKLNELVALGALRTLRHGRYKVWQLDRRPSKEPAEAGSRTTTDKQDG